ncbi:MAG: hypothetical protein M3Z98_04705 [Candidatus Dormibacteraeota bacterium]|nr:hypothetical protein [Candidatus Dormibacteraeota bacterium]
MLRWALPPAVLLASFFMLPVAIDSATPGSGIVITAQPAGEKLAVLAFSPFCVVVRIGDTAYGLTTSYALHQVAMAEPSTESTPRPLVLNPNGKEDIRVAVSFDAAATPRARVFHVLVAGSASASSVG